MRAPPSKNWLGACNQTFSTGLPETKNVFIAAVSTSHWPGVNSALCTFLNINFKSDIERMNFISFIDFPN
jgi:hypothetical protein